MTITTSVVLTSFTPEEGTNPLVFCPYPNFFWLFFSPQPARAVSLGREAPGRGTIRILGGFMENMDLTGIPEEAARIVTPAAEYLARRIGRRIESFNVIGSCLTGDFVPGSSDVNTAIVVNAIDPGILDELATMGGSITSRRLPPPVLLTRDYIARSVDSFPVEFLDMALFHKVILGDDVLEEIRIERPPLRLQCERDLKAKLVNLARGYIVSRGDAKLVWDLLMQALPGYFPLLRAVLFLVTGEPRPPAHKDDVLTRVEDALRVSMSGLRDALKLKSGQGRPNRDRARLMSIFHSVYRTTHELSETMDTLCLD